MATRRARNSMPSVRRVFCADVTAWLSAKLVCNGRKGNNRCSVALSDAIFDFDAAIGRLNRALARLDGAVDGMFNTMDERDRDQSELDVLIADRAKLAEELDASLTREKELEEIADEASEALGSAIAEVRAALGRVS